MSEDQNPSGTMADGTVSAIVNATGAHSTLPNAPNWFGALMRNPIQLVTLVGFLSLSGVQVGSLFTQDEDPAAIETRLKKEIERVERESDDRQLLEASARCEDALKAHDLALVKLGEDLERRDDDKFAFMSEITLYVERVSSAILGKRAKPPTGARLDEFTHKGTLRGLRQD